MKSLSKSLLLPILVLSTLFAPAALADACCEDDLMGLYFDPYAAMACAEGVVLYTPLTQYLILSNPTMPAIYGYECGITVTGNGALLLQHWTPCGMDLLPFDLSQIQVGCATPIPATEHTVLLTLQWMYMSATCEMVLFDLHGAATATLPGDLPVVQLDNGELRQTAVDRLSYVPATSAMTGMFDVCYPLATDEQTWDSMKAMYR